MPTHPKLSEEQIKNLRTLAAYLKTLPADYPDFEMNDYVSTGELEAHVPKCGTAACAVGHGPNAGMLPLNGETWGAYSMRVFIADSQLTGSDCDPWEWCFDSQWSDVDNTAHGAAERILHMLEHGVPDDALDQRYGLVPLSYRTEPTS